MSGTPVVESLGLPVAAANFRNYIRAMRSRSKQLLMCVYVILSSCHGRPSAIIKQGALEGVDLTTQDGRIISGFLGIPYARPPIGDLRFRVPQAASSWSGTYNATNGSIQCIQFRKAEVVGAEDCLYLNVYTPQLPEVNTRSLPVMVFVFGGILKHGSARFDVYDPNYILDHDVVLVTLNYRLGPLGFLTTGDLVAPGNFGLKDLILALRWVQENVAAFGGDPDLVTLFGSSAGSAAIHLLTLSDLTEGLFHRFIIQSATALSPGLYRDKSQSSLITMELAKSFNCSTANSSVIVNCLRDQDASSLVTWRSPIFVAPFVITNEPKSDEAVISHHPKSLIEQGKMRDLPWICGVTRDEGLLMTAPYVFDDDQWNRVLENFQENVDILTILLDVDDVRKYTNAIMKYYFSDMTVEKNLILQNYTAFSGDHSFVYPIVNLIQAQQRVATQPIYMYLFGYQDKHSTTYDVTGNKTVLGVCHGDEVIYLFSRYMIPDRNMSQTDLEMMRRMTGLWTSFAANGVPTLDGVDDAEEWLEYDESGRYLHIGDKTCVSLVMEAGLFVERMHFWRGLVGALSSAGSWRCSLDFGNLIVSLILFGRFASVQGV